MLASLLSALSLAAAGAQAEPAPLAVQVGALASDDCVGVDADGPSWDQCGFQRFAVSADASRILTVGSAGTVQLWDGEGRELRRIVWRDESGGASGWPNGEALILDGDGGNGAIGVVVVHSNQLLLLDLADGRTIAQRAFPDIMTIKNLRVVGNRVFAEVQGRDWRSGVRELLIPDGAFGDAAIGDARRIGPGYWVEGGGGPFTVRRADGTSFASPRPCMPLDARFCTDRRIGESAIHVLDVVSGNWRRFDLGRPTDEHTIVDAAAAGDWLFAVVCGRAGAAMRGRPCIVRDLAAGRDIDSLAGAGVRVVAAGVDEGGRPEARLIVLRGAGLPVEERRIGADGAVRAVAADAAVRLPVPGGGFLVPAGERESLFLAADGRARARFPFPAGTCGNTLTGWSGACRVAPGGARWVVPAEGGGSAPEDGRLDLILYAVPAAP